MGGIQVPIFGTGKKLDPNVVDGSDIPNNQQCTKTAVNNGISHLSTGAGFLLSTVCPQQNGESVLRTINLPESLKLRVCTLKLMVGRQAFPVGMAWFPGRDASFRECKCRIAKHKKSNRIR